MFLLLKYLTYQAILNLMRNHIVNSILPRLQALKLRHKLILPLVNLNRHLNNNFRSPQIDSDTIKYF